MSADDVPPTDMLYMTYEENWLEQCQAKVVGVKQDDKAVEVNLDQTVLHSQGGGQPTDKGSLKTASGATVDVSKVLINRETGVATHIGKLVEGDSIVLGDDVEVSIDTDERRILSECHTAGHVVDSAMARCGKLMKPTKGYHFLDGPYVEYEGVIPVEEREAVIKDLQTAFCQLIDEDIGTKIELMSKEDADALCNRQAQNFDMDIFADKRTNQIRVVTVAGYPCPCGGTHVRSTADLKERGWNVTGLKSKKGVVRVKYGQTAKS